MVIYLLQQSLPMRHKEFHCVNVPSALKYIVDFAVTKVTPKMADRVNVSLNAFSYIFEIYKLTFSEKNVTAADDSGAGYLWETGETWIIRIPTKERVICKQ